MVVCVDIYLIINANRIKIAADGAAAILGHELGVADLVACWQSQSGEREKWRPACATALVAVEPKLSSATEKRPEVRRCLSVTTFCCCLGLSLEEGEGELFSVWPLLSRLQCSRCVASRELAKHASCERQH